MLHIRIPVGIGAANCYIVADEATGEAAVIDPGGEADVISERLRSNGLTVKYIFLTHGHFDHILAVAELAASGADVVIHAEDARCLVDERESRAAWVSVRQTPRRADIHARDGDVFEVGSLRFRYMHTPGHSRGGCVIICGDRIYSGDTLFAGNCGRCDLPGGDYGQMLTSLKKIAELPGDYKVFPGHGPESSLAAERETNAYVRKALV